MRTHFPSSFRSIRARLTITFTLLIAVLLFGADVGLIGYAQADASHRANRILREGLESVEEVLVSEIDEARENVSPSATPPSLAPLPPVEALRMTRPELAEEGVSALIADNKGQVWRSGGEGTGPIWPRPQNGSDDGWRVRTARTAGYTLLVGVPWTHTERQLAGQAFLLTVLSAIAVAATAVGTGFLVGRTLRPIDLLAQQARQRAVPRAGLGRPQLSAPSADTEVVRLVATLNHLLNSIAESVEGKGRFYAAASHELRTPLQVLAGRVELTLSRPRTAEEYQSALREVQEQAERLTALVRSLLLLNRLDREGAEIPPPLPVEMVALCREQWDKLQPLIEERELYIDVEPLRLMPAVVVNAPPLHVEILLRNLLENAARYTPIGGTVRTSLRSASPGIELEIFNEFPPQIRLDTQHLVESFFRPDPARNSETGGNGLGLSICQALCTANGWQMTLRQDGEGIYAVVHFAATEDGE